LAGAASATSSTAPANSSSGGGASEDGGDGGGGIVTVYASRMGRDELPSELRGWIAYAPFVLVLGGAAAVLATLARQRWQLAARRHGGGGGPTPFMRVARHADDGDCWLDGLEDDEGVAREEEGGAAAVALPGRISWAERGEL